jgi:hypothetical protein
MHHIYTFYWNAGGGGGGDMDHMARILIRIFMIIKMADDFSVIDQESQDENVASCYQVETNLYDKGG